MAFTDAEKIDVRRFCGFAAFGGQPVQAFGHRFYQHYGTLEFRMNNMQDAEESIVRQYLADLRQLESDIVASRENLDTEQAAVWRHNSREVIERRDLFDDWRRRLCEFLGLAPGPGLGQSGLSLVV